MLRKIPQDTNVFHFINKNPKGLRTSDCVVRALANALDQSWEQTYKELYELGLKNSRPAEDDWTVAHYLLSKGCVRLGQPKRIGSKYTGKELCEAIQAKTLFDLHELSNKRLYLNIGSYHASSIVCGHIEDIWNCSNGAVGVVWICK